MSDYALMIHYGRRLLPGGEVQFRDNYFTGMTQEELDRVIAAREKRARSILIDPEDPAEGLVALFEAIRERATA